MKEFNMTSLREMLEQLSTPQLNEMLRSELKKEPLDENSARLILSILEEREADYPAEITPRVEKAWEKYQTRQMEEKSRTQSRQRQSRILKVASIAVVISLFLFIIPQRAQAERFWEKLARWTDDFLSFFSSDDGVSSLEYEFATDNPALQRIYDDAVELGVTIPMIPMWLSEADEIEEYKKEVTPIKTSIGAKLTDGVNVIIFTLDVYSGDPPHWYYRDDEYTETYEIEGTTYRVTQNKDYWVAVWINNNIECSIFIDCEEDTLRRILDSIYGMEETR